MVQSVVLRVREHSRGPIGALLVLWVIIQSISWMAILRDFDLVPLWVGSNLVFGLLIGIRRRMGTIVAGPLLALPMNVIPTFLGFQLAEHHGVLWGLAGATLYYLFFGWLLYGAVQMAILFAGAVIGRLLSAPFRRTGDVVIYGPDGQIT
jgi:hypothetical protein